MNSIAWHTSEGLSIQILEQESSMQIDADVLGSTCQAWNSYSSGAQIVQQDSGI